MIKTFEQFVAAKYGKPVNEGFQSDVLRDIIKQHGLPKREMDKKMLYDLKDDEIVDVVDSREEYYEKCELLRTYFENPALTTDVIVGFPGETQEEFEESKAFVDKVNFYETHIFKYSKRQGTKAAVMENQIPEQVKTARSNIMLEMDEQKREK